MTGLEQFDDVQGLTYKGRVAAFDAYRVAEGTREESQVSGTSIFDPVLCELCYSWFTAPGGVILDPFAGGSVRGIVASILGRSYVGVDLRPEQVAANEKQGAELCAGYEFQPRWICGDSAHVEFGHDGFDFVFSCPPYGDLEVYSDNAADLSTMPHSAFIEVYRAIIARSVAAMRDDRFAAFCVGDFRDSKGYYRNFVSDTIAAFQAAGAGLYNEAILITAVGSLPVRINGQWNSSRKLGKTHQNLLVFCNGDPKKAAAWINGAIAESAEVETAPAAEQPAETLELSPPLPAELLPPMGSLLVASPAEEDEMQRRCSARQAALF